MDEDVKMKTLAFPSFDEETTRLDHICFKRSLWLVAMKYYHLSSKSFHCDSWASQRGTWIQLEWFCEPNKHRTWDHLRSKSMDWFLYDNGLRHERVKDYILANKITVDKVDITRDMIKACNKLHMLYVQHLEEEKFSVRQKLKLRLSVLT